MHLKEGTRSQMVDLVSKWSWPPEFKSRMRLVAFHIAMIRLRNVRIHDFFPIMNDL